MANKQHQPTQPKPPKVNPNTTPAAEAKRARNHSPAIERKRAENAWHTNPLAPIPPKAIRQQAISLMRTLYKPGFEQLSNEEKRVNSISEKRKSDNSYYLNWLNQQSELLNAHEDAARTQLLAAGQQTQNEVAQGWDDLHGQLAANASSEAGVTSDPASGIAINLSDEAHKSANDIADQRTATQDQLGTLQTGASLGHTINMAEIAALEGRRIADQDEGLTTVKNQRQELRLNRASEAAKTFKEGLDKEVEKAQGRASIAASEATAAIEAKRFGLDASKAKLDAEEFGFEKGYKNRKFGLEQRELAQKQAEAKIHRELEEGKLTQTEAKTAIEKAQLQNEGKKIGNETKKVENEGNRTTGERAKAVEKQKAKNQQINANINTVLTQIQHNPKLQHMAGQNYQQLESILHTKYGYNPLAIAAAAQLYLNGEISPALKSKLEAVGYNGRYV